MKKKRLIPKSIFPGDTIGIVAPASPFDKNKFYKGLNVIESLGFKVFLPEGLFQKDGYLAGSDFHRAFIVNSLFADKAIDAIFCARGGFGSLKILPLIDYPMVRKNPKIFVGFSDISALLSSVYNECGLVAFHGPVVTSLPDADKRSIDSVLTAVSSRVIIEMIFKDGLEIKPGIASGKIIGGNLTTLCHLVGTPFEPDFNDNILFIEERGEAPYRIDRMLTQMKMAGCFDGLAGLVIGFFESCGSYRRICKIVEEIFSDNDIPVIAGLEVGHGKTNLTIPIGIEAVLDTSQLALNFIEPATR